MEIILLNEVQHTCKFEIVKPQEGCRAPALVDPGEFKVGTELARKKLIYLEI